MKKIIISLTTYPARIDKIEEVIKALLKQTVKADKILLYLAREQFEEGTIPICSSVLDDERFEVRWCAEDLKSFKKFYYVLQEFPDDIVITVDDDFIYKETMVEELLEYHHRYPTALLARRGYLITREDNGEIAPYKQWLFMDEMYIGTPRMDLFATTGGGTLFPPHVFGTEIYNKDVFCKYCEHADDIWIKMMTIIYNVPTVIVNNKWWELAIDEYKKDGLYQNFNDEGRKNIEYINSLLEYYGKKYDDLERRLFPDGGKYLSDIEAEKLKKYRIFTDKFSSHNKIVIYGAGIFAKRIYKLCVKSKVQNKIKAFVVNMEYENEESLFGINVENYLDYIDSDAFFVIALSDINQQEVLKDLKKNGLSSERIYAIDEEMRQVLRLMDRYKEI